MMPLLLAAMIAGLALHAGDLSAPLPLWPQLATVIGISLAGWMGLCLVMRALLLRRPRGRTLRRWELGGQALLLGWFAWVCLELGWAAAVPGTFVALIPFLLMTIFQWACLAAPIAKATGDRWTATSHLVHQLRFSGLPLIVALVLSDDLTAALLTRWLGPQSADAQAIRTAIIAGVSLAFAPSLLVRLLGAKPLPAGPLRTRLAEACALMGSANATLMHWPVPLPRFYNALVIGALPRLRYVVFSDDLLRDLQDRELLAVLGHELGHTQHRHIWLYLSLIVAVMCVSLPLQQLVNLGLLQPPAWLASLPPAWLNGLGLAVVGVFLYRVVFGMFSRACEREADLAGVRLSGDPEAMESALKTVARLSGQSETLPNWRHRSIAERVAYLRRVRADPHLATTHHLRMRFSLILLLVIMAVALAVNAWLTAPLSSTPVEATTQLEQWSRSDEDLQQALESADQGDPTALSKWYQRATMLDKRRLLYLHFALLESEAEAPSIYRYKRRLTAFVGIDTGDPSLNLQLDNTLAYGLVAGTLAPTSQDLDQARQLLPNLEQAVIKDPDHAIYDTIGCVHFVLKNYAKARDAFANARNRLASETKIPAPLRTRLEELYGGRLAAAERNLAANGGTLEPLPLDWPTPAAAP